VKLSDFRGRPVVVYFYPKVKFKGNERTTFVVDSDGKVAEVLRKVKPTEHDALVLEALKEV
jgi:peroxiredoxin